MPVRPKRRKVDETTKTNLVRSADFLAKYFSGKVLDIGCGKDIVCPNAQPFDLEHGDAQRICNYLPAHEYDTVHSSHCLEHMTDPEAALSQWWSLVKPGGYLVLVVPDEDLYEQGIWPSRFNSDHKATFRTTRETKFSLVSYDIRALVSELPQSAIVSIERQDHGYDYSLQSFGYCSTKKRPIVSLGFTRRMLRAISKPFPRIRKKWTIGIENFYFHRYGIPIDQTSRDALAQIQVVVQKTLVE